MIEGEKEKGVQDLGLCTPFFIRWHRIKMLILFGGGDE